MGACGPSLQLAGKHSGPNQPLKSYRITDKLVYSKSDQVCHFRRYWPKVQATQWQNLLLTLKRDFSGELTCTGCAALPKGWRS